MLRLDDGQRHAAVVGGGALVANHERPAVDARGGAPLAEHAVALFGLARGGGDRIDQGVAVIPWSPLARGRLTRGWSESSNRQDTDEYGKTLYNDFPESDRHVIEAVGKVAAARGVPRAQVALAWLLQKKGVTAPIVGASKGEQLSDAAAALRHAAYQHCQIGMTPLHQTGPTGDVYG